QGQTCVNTPILDTLRLPRNLPRIPGQRSSRVGMAWTPNRCEICGEVSTFTLTSLTWPARSPASCSSAELTIRQGPHHVAHKSTTTGLLADSATSPKVASSASAIQGRGWRHLPHRGVPAAAAGTRLAVPQCPHLTTPPVMAPLFSPAPAAPSPTVH